MIDFDYVTASDVDTAVHDGASNGTRFIAGGTNLVDLMKLGVENPTRVVDLNTLRRRDASLTTVSDLPNGGLRLGALAHMSDVAWDPRVQERYPLVVKNLPVISRALLESAAPQIRNVASLGGNLMQRTRCAYFRELTWTPCNKRNPGTGCSAIEGENRLHAVLGTSDACIATHPSDFAVALAAMDGVITLTGPSGERKVNATDFHVLPGTTPWIEHDLKPGEMITSIFIPDAPYARRSAYLKVRDRSAYGFALSAAAVGLDVNGGQIRSARLALGGVGTKPWRATDAEQFLAGREPSPEIFRDAAEIALRKSVSYGQNGFKIELAKRTIVRAFSDLAGGVA